MKFFQQAYSGNNEWWAYGLTLIVLLIGWQFIGVVPLMVVAYSYSPDIGAFMEAASDAFSSLGINSNIYLILIISTFVFGLIFLIFGVKYIHRRSLKSVLTTRDKVDWGRIYYAFFVWLIIGIIMVGISYMLAPEDFIWNFKPLPFTFLVLISFLLLPLQTSFEEILFRGYLMQGFGTWLKSPFMAVILTAVIFGALHGLNPEVEKLGWTVMIFYMGTGLLLGLFTIFDEGTELALGFHAANNIIAAVLVTTNWTVFQTDALLIDTSEPSLGAETLVPVFVLYPFIIYLFSKKYDWSDWRTKLFEVITKPEEKVEIIESEDQV